ncbi:hypothetical protein ZIOFF_068191 [Zingiber officinale]|uniref:Uncharacterized protein n=1 Tax=Zingiber officinale TaxID=94328 RepID=A0A8J5CEE3_ZINOF|nr:hypothetical protein ZIOFF_068191 [Zingiber officinale]
MLLHFVVEEVVWHRDEGGEGEILHQVGPSSHWGISDEFTNVKKVAYVDPNSLAEICASLGACLTEIKKFLDSCGDDRFMREMQAFVRTREE